MGLRRTSLSLVTLLVAAAILWSDTYAWAPQPTTRRFGGMERTSHYITMRDGVRLAADIYLPKGLAKGERTATILHLTRYYRSVSIRTVFRVMIGSPRPLAELETRERLVKAGYSWVDVDVRGTGASFGRWKYPLAPDEVQDGRDVTDWIVAQPWSAGAVGVIGGSYNASLAVMQLANDHPAHKAVVSNFGFWDAFGEAFAPGGLQAIGLVRPFSELLAGFDKNNLGPLGVNARVAVGGVFPADRALLPAAQAERGKNSNLEQLLAPLHFRDAGNSEVEPGRLMTFDHVSPHAVVGHRSRVPVLSYSGWFDNAFQRSTLRQFLATRAPGSKVRIGPWSHGVGMHNISPYAAAHKKWDDHVDEIEAFFDRHLRGLGAPESPDAAVQFYVMGDEQWRSSSTWPIPGGVEQTMYLSASSSLVPAPPGSDEESDRYQVNPRSSRGTVRWGFEIGSGAGRRYRDQRAVSSALLHYTSRPIVAPLTVIGEPLVELFMSANATDGGVFVYLEDVAPDGHVRYVTEGQLRLLNRAWHGRWEPFSLEPLRQFLSGDARPMVPGRVESVVLDLLPTAYTFPAGHSVRVSIAGADAGNFKVPVTTQPLVYEVHRDREHHSRISLPTYPTAPRVR